MTRFEASCAAYVRERRSIHARLRLCVCVRAFACMRSLARICVCAFACACLRARIPVRAFALVNLRVLIHARLCPCVCIHIICMRTFATAHLRARICVRPFAYAGFAFASVRLGQLVCIRAFASAHSRALVCVRALARVYMHAESVTYEGKVVPWEMGMGCP